MTKYDYTIIGGGSIGMAIALRLGKGLPNAKICVVEGGTHPAASKAAGAMLGCFAEVTKYTFDHPANAAKFDLMYAAHKAWPSWMKEVEADAGEKIKYIPGTHVMLNTQGGVLDDQNFEAVIAALEKFNEPYEVVDPRDIEGLDPMALARPLRAIYLPNEGSVESGQYLEVLRKASINNGVEFIDEHISFGIVADNDGYMFKSDGNEAHTENLVIAAGSITSNLIDENDLGISIMPVLSGAGVAVVTRRSMGKAFKHTIRTSNRAGSCGLHLVPMDGEKEYLGATNVVFGDPEHETSLGMSHFLAQCAMDQLSKSLYFSRIEGWRAGNRPVSLDTLPLIGKTSKNNLYIATGTYRDGFHCSPVIAESIVNEITGNEPLISDMFKPERMPIETMSQEVSVDEYGMQAASGGYENWMHLPYYMPDTDIAEPAKMIARSIYEKLGTNMAFHPDILLYLSSSETEFTKVLTYLGSLEN